MAPNFTPAQCPPAGTALYPPLLSKLFTPLQIRGLTAQDRHLAHVGGIIQRGPSLSVIESTAVPKEGRITLQDFGIWEDSQLIRIQLSHAERKASTVAPFLDKNVTAEKEDRSWPDEVHAPSAVPFNDAYPLPKALTVQQIRDLKDAFFAAALRLVKAGLDMVEIHAANGYLIHQFLSPVSNRRTDEYGGSFETRMPLFVRISITDWLDDFTDEFPESGTAADSCRLAPILAAHGVDFLDVISGGIHPKQATSIKSGDGYQALFALKIVKGRRRRTPCWCLRWVVSTAKITEGFLQDGLDVVMCGRWFQENPSLVYQVADELGVKVKMSSQYRWALGGGRKRK
ncbi:hypothetical protein BDW75DRAFT_234223 [Aspergillus navahoensis]